MYRKKRSRCTDTLFLIYRHPFLMYDKVIPRLWITFHYALYGAAEPITAFPMYRKNAAKRAGFRQNPVPTMGRTHDRALIRYIGNAMR